MMCATTGVECLCVDEGVGVQGQRELLRRLRAHAPKPPPPLPPPSSDTLAVLTAYHRQLLEAGYAWLDTVSHTPAVSVLLRTTQPAHLLMVGAVLLVSALLHTSGPAASTSGLTSLAYLASFSTHIGNQFWMTFVSGLALYFNLPRHDFGAVQKILFPKYFSINSFLSMITLVTFTKLHHVSTTEIPEILQTVALSVCLLLELTTRLYVVPSVIHLITVKTKLEVAAGVGGEVGHFSPGALLACPHYRSLQQEFRRQHTMVAIANITTMACSSVHLYYLAVNYSFVSVCPI